MSYYVFFTILLQLTKDSLSNRQSSVNDFPSKFSSQNLKEIQTVDFDALDLRSSLFSEGRSANAKVTCSDSTLKSTKLKLLKLQTANFSTDSLDTHKYRRSNGVNANVTSILVVPWYFEVFKSTYYMLKRCQSEVECYQKRIIRGMDRILEINSVKLAEGVYLVKDREEEVSTIPRDSEGEPFMIAVSRRIIRVLKTHTLRVRLGITKENLEQARLGHHHSYRHAFPMMVGSFMLLASFMVPMGFQFLAVVGGKALVLSQIALVMAMGSTLQRFFGFGNQKQSNVGGVVQHEYYQVRDDVQPWQRQGAEDKHQTITYPHRQLTGHQQQMMNQQLTQQQLHGLMNYHQP